jgi:CRISPR-associated protein Csm3
MSTHTEENEKELVNAVFDALQLVQDDYLGGSGSRGYGQVKFVIEKLIQKTNEDYKNTAQKTEKEYTFVSVPPSLK